MKAAGSGNLLRDFEKRHLMTYKMFNVQKFCIFTFQNRSSDEGKSWFINLYTYIFYT